MQSDWTFEAICRARLRSRADPGHSSDNFTVIAVRDREKVFYPLHQPLVQRSNSADHLDVVKRDHRDPYISFAADQEGEI